MSKTSKNTKEKIVNAAWKLFYKQGYENTTIEDIIDEAHVSKGSFYHYFEGKESLIEAVAVMIDSFYEDIIDDLGDDLSAVDKLVKLTQEVFFRMENTIPVHLLSRIMAGQLTARGDRYLMNPDRPYFRVVRQLVIEGKEQGCFAEKFSVNEITIAYALFERGIMYDWCISNGNYPFNAYASKMMRVFLNGFTM